MKTPILLVPGDKDLRLVHVRNTSAFDNVWSMAATVCIDLGCSLLEVRLRDGWVDYALCGVYIVDGTD